jgi:proton-coupled amino acid transporter
MGLLDDEAPVVNDEPTSPLLARSKTQFKPFGLFWNIVKSFAGAGTFALPFGIKNAGLWGGLVGVTLIALLANYTIRTLMKCGDRVMQINRKKHISDGEPHPPSYPEIGRAAMGEFGAKIVSLFSALMCFGVNLAYFTLIAGNIVALFPHSAHVEPVYVIAVIFPFCVFLSCLTDLTKLAYTSIAGSIALLIAMGAVVIFGLTNHMLKPVHDYPAFEWKTFPVFLGGAVFLFCDHVIVLPLANSCGDYRRFPRVLDYAMVFVTVINIVFAGLAYAYWGDSTCGNVIGNLPKNSAVGDIVRIGISLEVLASFPLVANAGFQALESGFYLEKVRAFPYLAQGSPHPFFSRNIFYYCFRVGIILGLAVLAVALAKQFGLLVSLIGSLTIMCTGFVFPQIFYMKLHRHELKKYDIVIQCSIILFGLAMTGLGTYQSLAEIISSVTHPSHTPSPCDS